MNTEDAGYRRPCSWMLYQAQHDGDGAAGARLSVAPALPAGMAFETIRLEISPAAVATLTLNRPDTLNALNGALIEETRAALASLPESGARCLLLTGEGRAFSSGADLATGGGL